MEQERLTLSGHMSSSRFSKVRVAQSFVWCFLDHCLPLSCLQTFYIHFFCIQIPVISGIRVAQSLVFLWSGVSFFCPFSIGHRIVCPFSIGHRIVCPFSIGHRIVCPFSIGHRIICPFSIGLRIVCPSIDGF